LHASIEDPDSLTLKGISWPIQTAHAEAPLTDPTYDPDVPMRAEPFTWLLFPTTIHPTSSPPSIQLKLMGLGVRTVSFLAVRVYVAGFYVDEEALRCLKYMPAWKGFTAEKLLTAPKPGEDDGEVKGEALMKQLLEQPGEYAMRIVPVRPTDFGHLRDGFTRSLLARLKQISGGLSEEESEAVGKAVNDFKACFPSGVSVPKGAALLMIRGRDGSLRVEFQGKLLGTVSNKIISREILMAYFADKNVVSQRLKESVALDFEGVTENPLERKSVAKA